ncbi:hypothetical protein DFH08DRAFT_1077875 [Mycena albidolilacea]|uniref:G-protein coupled receptors family 2 profile 2 domain-containing protein n=1 Tax=Mycena albidolilacea TaxID=1033008 RepID=A0AAD7A8C9_9AGAR|nr:hypothetical protein DFH08DRAFT_1077875 [Mycena albidolilacea]
MWLALASKSWSPDTQIWHAKAALRSTQIILGLIIPGMGLTTALLILCGYAAWNPVSRRYLDRVSFRLLIHALLAHLIFGVAFTFGSLTAHRGWRCDLLSFCTNLSLVFSAGMFFCMALNLPLVLAHNVSGQKMERYYVLGTMLLCLLCTVVPYASGNLGWNAINDTCWYRSQNGAAMLRWLIATQTLWMLLFAAGEVGAFVVIVGYLIAYEIDMRRFPTNTQSKNTCSSEVSHRPGSTIRMFRNIILRVGLYPLVSCLLNISTSVLDLYVMKHPESSKLNWTLNLTDLAIYSGRPLIYGLLAATDPSFIRALRALRHPEDETSQTQAHDRGGSGRPPHSGYLSTVFDLPPDEVDPDAVEPDKDDARDTETSTALTLTPGMELDERRDRSRHERSHQNGVMPTSAPLQQSIDLACHI